MLDPVDAAALKVCNASLQSLVFLTLVCSQFTQNALERCATPMLQKKFVVRRVDGFRTQVLIPVTSPGAGWCGYAGSLHFDVGQ